MHICFTVDNLIISLIIIILVISPYNSWIHIMAHFKLFSEKLEVLV
jgi:hypothetical protein